MQTQKRKELGVGSIDTCNWGEEETGIEEEKDVGWDDRQNSRRRSQTSTHASSNKKIRFQSLSKADEVAEASRVLELGITKTTGAQQDSVTLHFSHLSKAVSILDLNSVSLCCSVQVTNPQLLSLNLPQ